MNYTFDCYERLRNGAPARRGCALKDEYEDIWIVNVPILLPGGVTRNVQLLIFVFGKECTLSTEQPNLIFYFDVIACCVWLSIISGNKSYEFIINIIASRIIAFYLRMIHESYHEYQCLQSKSSRVRNCSRIVSGVLFFSFAIERELRYTHFRSRVARWKRGTRDELIKIPIWGNAEPLAASQLSRNNADLQERAGAAARRRVLDSRLPTTVANRKTDRNGITKPPHTSYSTGCRSFYGIA